MKSIIKVNGREMAASMVSYDALSDVATFEDGAGEKYEVDLDENVVEVNIFGALGNEVVVI